MESLAPTQVDGTQVPYTQVDGTQIDDEGLDNALDELAGLEENLNNADAQMKEEPLFEEDEEEAAKEETDLLFKEDELENNDELQDEAKDDDKVDTAEPKKTEGEATAADQDAEYEDDGLDIDAEVDRIAAEVEDEEAKFKEPKRKTKAKKRTRTGDEVEREMTAEIDSSRAEFEQFWDSVTGTIKTQRRDPNKIVGSEVAMQEQLAQVREFLAKMDSAADSDRKSNAQRKPCAAKLSMLSVVRQMVQKRSLHDDLLTCGLLRRFRDWLLPLPDGSWPSSKVRGECIAMLKSLRLEQRESARQWLDESQGLGRVLMNLWRSEGKETPDNRRALHDLLQRWLRPLFSLSVNHARLHDVEGDTQMRTRIARRAKLLQRQHRTLDTAPGIRARVPERAEFDFAVRPKSILPTDAGRRVAKHSAMQKKLKEIGKRR
ncbi:MAG: hypothetical protein MHM6MM_001965 [Cercozoa sp. M6MM]